jgi:uncharacterized protein (TIGR02246 family)
MRGKIMKALAIFSFLVLAAVPLGAQDPALEGALDALAQKYSDAWKAGDAAGCASIYSDDADVVDFMGVNAKGKAAIQESLTKTLGMYPGGAIQIVRTGIHAVSADVVVSDGTWEITGATAPERVPTKGFYTVVAAKQGDAWQIVSGRTKVAPPMN